MTTNSGRLALWTLAALAVVALATLAPGVIIGPVRAETFAALAGTGADWGDLERVANTMLFLPVGATAGLLFGRRWWPMAVVLSSAVSLTVEAVQSHLPGRVPDLEDVLWNTLGATLGSTVVGAGMLLAHRFEGRRDRGSGC